MIDTRNPLFKIVFHTKRFGRFEVGFGESLVEKQVIAFTTSRHLGNAAGQFSIELTAETIAPSLLGFIGSITGVPGQMFSSLTWYDILSTMDYVELWAWSPPLMPDRPLMRGFIDTVNFVASIGGDHPQVRIMVRGRDFGKLALITKMYYVNKSYASTVEILNQWRQGIEKIFGWDNGTYPQVVKPPFKDGETSTLIFSPSILVGTIWETFVKPQMDGVRFSFPDGGDIPECRFAPWVDSWEQNLSTIDPKAVQHNVQPWADIWSILVNYQHAPWREMWVGEEPDGSRLFYRPAPWYDKAGGWAQENPLTWTYPANAPFSVQPVDEKVRSILVSIDDVIHLEIGRSEDRMKNFFFTYADQFGAFAQYAKDQGKPLEGHGDEAGKFDKNPYLVGVANQQPSTILESDYRRYGFRLYEARTKYFSPAYGPLENKVMADLGFLRQQGVVGNLRLAHAFDHEDILEYGGVVLKGGDYRIGDYLRLPDLRFPKLPPSLYYAEGVSHTFQYGTQPFDGRWTTTIQLARGRGHLDRIASAGILVP